MKGSNNANQRVLARSSDAKMSNLYCILDFKCYHGIAWLWRLKDVPASSVRGIQNTPTQSSLLAMQRRRVILNAVNENSCPWMLIWAGTRNPSRRNGDGDSHWFLRPVDPSCDVLLFFETKTILSPPYGLV